MWSAITWMLVTDVEDERSWWQFEDVGDVFGRLSDKHRLFSHQHRASTFKNDVISVISQCQFWKQNPDQIPNFQKITRKIGIRLVGKSEIENFPSKLERDERNWKEPREVGKFLLKLESSGWGWLSNFGQNFPIASIGYQRNFPTSWNLSNFARFFSTSLVSFGKSLSNLDGKFSISDFPT